MRALGLCQYILALILKHVPNALPCGSGGFGALGALCRCYVNAIAQQPPPANHIALGLDLCRTRRVRSLPFVLPGVVLDGINSLWALSSRLMALRYGAFRRGCCAAAPAGFNGSMFSGHHIMGIRWRGRCECGAAGRGEASLRFLILRPAQTLPLHGHVSTCSHVARLQWLVKSSTPRIRHPTPAISGPRAIVGTGALALHFMSEHLIRQPDVVSSWLLAVPDAPTPPRR